MWFCNKAGFTIMVTTQPTAALTISEAGKLSMFAPAMMVKLHILTDVLTVMLIATEG